MKKTQFSQDIKVFRSNNAMEFRDTEFLGILTQNGTIVHRSCPGISQQNSQVECKHRHILDGTSTL